MEPTPSIPSYQICVVDIANNFISGVLEPAIVTDLPTSGQLGWTCDWQNLWENSDFDCEAIVKLQVRGQILGLMKFALYPYPTNTPEFLEVLNLEALQGQERSVKPVGLWLLWYAATISLARCSGDDRGTLMQLDAMEVSIEYYRNKVRMEGLGWVSLGTEEKGYAFRFSRLGAAEFCSRTEGRFGAPIRCR